MDDGKYDDLISQRAEVDRVREASYQRAPYLALNTRVRQRSLEDTVQHPLALRGKGAGKPGTLILVPVTGVE